MVHHRPATAFTLCTKIGAHAFLIAGALACSVAWRDGERATRAFLGALFWVAAQSLRPTLFPLAIFLPLLLVKRGASRRYAAISVALWAFTLLTPAFVMGANYARHGIVTSGHVLAVNLGCYAVPRLRYLRHSCELPVYIFCRTCIADADVTARVLV